MSVEDASGKLPRKLQRCAMATIPHELTNKAKSG
jgi:hypothetical protein